MTAVVDDRRCGAAGAAASRRGRPVTEAVHETLAPRLADAAMDEADHDLIEQARAEAAKQGGVEFEAFFDDLDQAFPLELKVPNAETRRAMAESKETMRRGTARFASADEVFAELEEATRQ